MAVKGRGVRASKKILKIIEKLIALCYNIGMESVTVQTFAKINLSLDITGARGGYHMIDSVVASIDMADTVTVRPRNDGAVNISMRGMGCEDIPASENNAAKAAEAVISRYGTLGADIFIEKTIPIGAGLGGSSADVAGVLNALSELYEIRDGAGIKALADGIGSDCGYMLHGGYARITGRGERVSRIESPLSLCLILLMPEGGVSTAKCYALSDAYPEKRHTSNAVQRAICGGLLPELGAALSNGLYPAAAVINPFVRDAFSELCALSPLGVNMTGSGSAVYALFADKDARDKALAAYSGQFAAVAAHTIIPPRYL